jgi:flagellar hook-associated protein 3 FlgL
MTIRPFVPGNFSLNSVAPRLISQKSILEDLQRQLATDKIADSYAGLGVQRVTALDIRQKLTITEGYQSTAKDVAQRLKFMDNAFGFMARTTEEFASIIGPSSYSATLTGQPVATNSALGRLDEMIDHLNTKYADRYLFSGRASDTRPVASSTAILEGDATGDGLRTLINERRIADTGTGTGRTVIGGAGAVATLDEQAAGLPFGLKFDTTLPATTRSTLSNATIVGPAGAPAGVSVTFTGQPQDGEQLVFQFRLPDNSVKEVRLSASVSASTAATADSFQIGATPAATAANLRTALDLMVRRETDSSLRAASALEVAKDFFAQRPRQPSGDLVPQRIAAPVTGASTAYAPTGTRPTVAFYRGEDTPVTDLVPTATSVIRSQVGARIEEGVTASVGVRANEAAFGEALAAIAVFAIEDFTVPTNATAEDKLIIRQRYETLATHSRTVLKGNSGSQTLTSIHVEIGNAQALVKDATERLGQRRNIFQTVLGDIENIDREEVSSKILSLQTSLQASYQVTALVSRLSLVQYL